MKIFFPVILVLQLFVTASAQKSAVVKGFIGDSLQNPIDLVSVSIPESASGTMTNTDGFFELNIPADTEVKLQFSCVGYETNSRFFMLKPAEVREIRVVLSEDVKNIDEISISMRQDKSSTFQRINLKDIEYMPTATGKIASFIKLQPGVSSNNELSSQYSVRGGNFDENLVYVNDIEIYRPFLVRSGQQEGLSFVNSDLVSSVRFSAGGFDARYGDKMSSALDITYKRPVEFAGSASVSLLGTSVHLEGSDKSNKFTYLCGYRYKTTTYLLNTLETKGDYEPRFSDLQALLTYDISRKVSISLLGNFSSNAYLFVPKTRKTDFGTSDVPINLNIFYEGKEVDQFNTYLGALSLNLKPSNNLDLKFILNGFRTNERETFDIQGAYWINELDNTIGSETFGDSILNLAVGVQHDHARNYLDAYVFSAAHIGTLAIGNQILKWGFKYQYQDFYERINEWRRIDSAGYSIPYTGDNVNVTDYSNSENNINYGIITSFIQDTWEFNSGRSDYFLTAGVRGSLWNFNKKFMVSPRATLAMEPYWERDMLFRISGGYYYQPPFYKELRMPNDNINYSIEPQRSIHMVIGGDYLFTAWERPFKLTTELYYKWLHDLIPYKIENVRIQYAGENIATGYAKGIDLKLNGEFVPGAESWFSASLMQTREDIEGDSVLVINGDVEMYEEAGYYSRPTDQLFTTGIYFQDFLPDSPEYKVHLSAFYGTGLPLSHPKEGRYYTKKRFKMTPYRRVDIGFSKSLKRKDSQGVSVGIFSNFKSVWISAEVFNLLGIKNEASRIWIRTLSNQQGVPSAFAVQNYLTGRRFNVKLSAKF